MLDIHHNKHLCTVSGEHTWAFYNDGEQCTSFSGWERIRLSMYALNWISFFTHLLAHSFGRSVVWFAFLFSPFFRFHLHHRMVI